jgi:GT2 family glycosyltransferase
MDKKVVVVLLTWQRINNLKTTLASLSRQTYKNFDVYISNANHDRKGLIERYVHYAKQSRKLNVEVSHDSNERFAWRRFDVGRKLAKQGYDVVLFIDDDVTFPLDYVAKMIKAYEPNTYASNFAWSFQDKGSDYYKKRTKAKSTSEEVHYCGTGVSMIDASIFLDNDIQKAPEAFYVVEDLWLSYYAQHVLGWKLKYVEIPNVVIKGGDSVALYRKVAKSGTDKADLLRMLVNEYGWKL